jgi:hypothetical protein
MDLVRLFLPLCLGVIPCAIGYWAGRRRAVAYVLVALAAAGTAMVIAALFAILPPKAGAIVAACGGPTLVLCWLALLALGVAWQMVGHRWCRPFLYLAAAAGCVIAMEGGAGLWWRFGVPGLWKQRADARGGRQQATGFTCYPAAAVMLLHHYGITAGEGEMAYYANTTLFGTDEHAMARALTAKLRSRGWQAFVEAADYETCVQDGGPFIAHVAPPGIGEHAIFVRKALPDVVAIIDPIKGVLQHMPRAEFETIWYGTLIRIRTGESRYSQDARLTTANHAFGPPSEKVKSFRSGITSICTGWMDSITQP